MQRHSVCINLLQDFLPAAGLPPYTHLFSDGREHSVTPGMCMFTIGAWSAVSSFTTAPPSCTKVSALSLLSTSQGHVLFHNLFVRDWMWHSSTLALSFYMLVHLCLCVYHSFCAQNGSLVHCFQVASSAIPCAHVTDGGHLFISTMLCTTAVHNACLHTVCVGVRILHMQSALL